MRRMPRFPALLTPDRRALLSGALGALIHCAIGGRAIAAPPGFANWVAEFRGRALRRGISAQTYARAMNGLEPDMSVFDEFNSQPELTEVTWQYINRRCSDWRVMTGRERGREYAGLLSRIEKDYGVDRYILLALWGMESSFGDLSANRKYMRPVIPALAALAWHEPRRRHYWETELLNALTIVDKGWAQASDMIGSWAGAMGHTQWMPEVWLHMGVDFDRNGRISPYGPPDDALAGTARFLVERGVARADGAAFARPDDRARLTVPVEGGPAFLIGQNFSAVMSYNPAFSYALAVMHLADRIRGDGPFVHPFPGSERLMTLAEVQELQRRLTALGFDTDGSDGRVGRDTQRAVRAFQQKVGM